MQLLRLAPVVAWAGLIFLLSSVPNPPGATGSEWQSNLAHAVEYAILAVLLWWGLRGLRPDWSMPAVAAVTWLACVAYGISDEWHQSFVANRDANATDVAFDALGAALGTAAAWALALRTRRAG